MRIGRIICNAIIRYAAPRLDRHNTTVAAKASSIISQMQLDVLASAPQYLGLIGEDDRSSTLQYPEDAYSARLPEPPSAVWKTANIQTIYLPCLRMSRAHQLLWSVGLVGRAVDVAHPIRTIVCKILRLVGEGHGLSQAFVYASALEKDRMSNGNSCSLFPN